MDRRQFLGSSALLGALFFPGWLGACCQAGDPGGDVETGDDAIGALLADADGRDVLLVRVDDDDERAADLGRAVGALLFRGSDEHLAPLAVLHVVCATTDRFDAIAPTHARPEVRAVLVRHDRSQRVALAGDPPPYALESEEGKPLGSYESSEKRRQEWLSRQLAEAIGSDAQTLAARADDERARIPGWIAPHDPSLEVAARWPWNSRLMAVRDPQRSSLWTASLAAVVVQRFGTTPPAGSAWSTSGGGCGRATWPPPPGRSAPDADRMAVACGMAYMPESSRRFLHFYSREELGT